MLYFQHLSRLPSIEHGITESGDEPPFSFVRGEQIHKDRAAWIGKESGAIIHGVDALATTETDLGLGVLCADCVPILFADTRTGIVGTIHAGWRGTALDITRKTIEFLKIKPFHLLVGIGPAICPNCFEVGEEVARQFDPSVVRESEKTEGTCTVDLWQANVLQCLESGVPERNIEVMRICTFEHTSLYSFRRGDREKRNSAYIARRRF